MGNISRLLAVIGFGIPLTNCSFHRHRAKSFMDENLSNAMDSLEQSLEITYQDRPEIVIVNKIKGDKDKLFPTSGQYHDGSIILPKRLFDKDGKPIDEEEVDEVTKHELGHHYVAQVLQSHGVEEPEFNNNCEGWYSLKLVNQGIARYFEYGPLFSIDWDSLYHLEQDKSGDPIYNLSIPPLECDLDTVFNDPLMEAYSTFYRVGHPLVTPIIFQHGSKGVDYLILNPPTTEDLQDLSKYQNRALLELGGEGIDRLREERIRRLKLESLEGDNK